MNLEIKKIAAEETYPLRHKILRPHQPIEKCFYDGDSVPRAFHLGAILNGSTVGIVSCAPENSSLFADSDQFRIRGMAVEPEIRRQGIGAELMNKAEKEIMELGADLIWFNAREIAFLFYQSLGYEFATEMFEIEGIGPHRVMYKRLRK